MHPNEFVIFFSGALLERRRWVTVKYIGPAFVLAIELQSRRIGEFTSIVAKKGRHNGYENIRSKFEIQIVDYVNNRLRIIKIPDKGQHEFGFHKVYG